MFHSNPDNSPVKNSFQKTFVHLETSENAYFTTERCENADLRHIVFSGASFFASTHPYLVRGLAIIIQT